MANQNRYKLEIKLLCEKGHRTADQIYTELKKNYFFLGKGTVYRNLQEMVDEGVLMKTSGVIDKVLYEMKKEAHAHLFCRKTGWILDVDLSSLPRDAIMMPEDFNLEKTEIAFYGYFGEPDDNCDGGAVLK